MKAGVWDNAVTSNFSLVSLTREELVEDTEILSKFISAITMQNFKVHGDSQNILCL